MIQGDSRRNQRESYRNQKRRLQGEIQRTEPESDAGCMFPVPLRWESSGQAKDFSFEGMEGHGLLHQIILIS